MTYKFSADITDSDLLALEIFGVAVGADPIDAASVWMNESGLYTTALNKSSYSAGLFQAMPQTLKNLGYAPQLTDDKERALQFCKESFSAQLIWARRYYTPYKGKLINSASFYVATFLPADLAYAATGNLDTVLVAKGGRRGWAFDANAGFDSNHDLTITVGELEQAIERACHSDRWYEISERMHDQLNIVPPAPFSRPPLYSPMWLQQSLKALGYDPGTIDGIWGQNTRDALMAFQKANGLAIDGILGPESKHALISALDKLKTNA